MSQSSPAEPKCPLCRHPASAVHTPFCSARCKDRDLLAWLGDGYAIPGEPVDMTLDNPDHHD
ncbi:DNA gyrase inhibitor YacG [Glacieibacterium sp.]|uniref:DNA gyrase inhibitor YacG n=1 Tax=Glacieibacterium sp. TaxID=2860237 RepID=UPI003B0039E9